MKHPKITDQIRDLRSGGWQVGHWRFGPFYMSLEVTVGYWIVQICLNKPYLYRQGVIHREMIPFTKCRTGPEAFEYLNNYAEYQWELWEAEFETL